RPSEPPKGTGGSCTASSSGVIRSSPRTGPLATVARQKATNNATFPIFTRAVLLWAIAECPPEPLGGDLERRDRHRRLVFSMRGRDEEFLVRLEDAAIE